MKNYIAIILLSILSVTSYCHTIEVQRIVDGDTFEDTKGNIYRMLGINSPEKSEEGGYEAKMFLDSLINKKVVSLGKDYNNDTTDIYKRHLVYVYSNGIDINKKLIIEGHAIAYTKYPFSKMEEYVTAQSTIVQSDLIENQKKIELELQWKYILLGIIAMALSFIGLYYYYV